jgi:hypothetical protein
MGGHVMRTAGGLSRRLPGIGWLMIALFVCLFHGPWLAFKRGVDAEDWPSAGASLNRIRQIIAVNLPLGLLVVVISAQWALLRLTLSRTALLSSVPGHLRSRPCASESGAPQQPDFSERRGHRSFVPAADIRLAVRRHTCSETNSYFTYISEKVW